MKETLLSPHPKGQERGYHSFANQHPTKQFPILWKCQTRTLSACTSNLWEQMFDFQRYIRFLLRLILSLQDLLQKLSLEMDPFDNLELSYPRNNIVGSHLCDDWKKSNELSVCYRLQSMLWQLQQVCPLTRECQVHLFVPSTSTSRQFVSIVLDSSLTVSPSWSDDRPSKELRLCATALSFLWAISQIFDTFSHDLPYRTTMGLLLCGVFPTQVTSQLLQHSFVIPTCFSIGQ